VRSAHASEIAEDYTEAVADLIASHGEARVVDVARALGVTHVTVTRTVARLQRDGWLTAEPYRSIFLTPRGATLAAKAKRRHDAVVRFLLALGVDRATAHADAEGIEHHVSPKTLRAIERFVAGRE
jgi:DtxR family manganese transport transcriptional regulator